MPIPSALPRGTALFTFHGRVVRGKRLGSRLGFPTANIAYDPQSRAWPREGVYVGVARLDGESRGYVCIINQGRHPTVPEGMATVEALPIDLFAPGNTPIAANYTENGYRDDTIIVELEQKRMYDSDVFIAYVKIATPSQLRTAVAGQKIGSSSTNHTSTICQNYNGIVAINGDYFTKTKAGYIVRMGETYREKTSQNMDLLLIDELGDFHIYLHGHDVQENGVASFLSEHEIVNGFFFGPALVVDGEVQEIPENYQFDPHQKNPRAGIAQLGMLTYALVAVNGRTDQSAGVTLAEFADIMGQLGAEQAYNLDGGNSATLAFNGEVYNDKPQAERSVTDIIYFASATAGE